MKTKYVFLLLVAAGIYCLGLVPTTDPDLWWHLKTGETILQSGIPKADLFSLTVTGKAWITHEWLSEVVFYVFYRIGGLPCLMILFAFLGILIYGLVYRLSSGKFYLAGLLTFLAFLASRFLWGVRPQIFNILLLAVLLWLVQSVRMGRRNWKWLYALPLLNILWVNLHSGYMLGIIVLFVFLAGDAFQIFVLRLPDGTVGSKAIKHLAMIATLCLFTSLVNPAGYKILLYPFETLSSKMMPAYLLEWQTPVFRYWNFWPFLGIMLLGVLAFMNAPARGNTSDFLLYGSSMVMGLLARRHVPFFAIVSIPIISKALIDAWRIRNPSGFSGKIEGDSFKDVRRFVNPLLAIFILAGVFFWTGERLKNNETVIAKNYPVDAVRFLKEKGLVSEIRLFNEYTWGGYLIWNGIPVFMDGRADLYGDLFFSDYLAIRDAKKNWSQIHAVFSEQRINALLLRPRSPLAMLVRMNQEWREIYRDDLSSVFLH